MAARSYKDVKQVIESLGIEFTGKSRVDYRKNVSSFATRARGWSESRFNKEIKSLLEVQFRRERYKELRKEKIGYKEARKVSSYRGPKYDRYKKARTYYDRDKAKEMTKYDLKRFRDAMNKVTKKEGVSKADREARRRVWANWSHEKKHPDYYKNLAYEANEFYGVDKNSNPGWAAMYYHYVYGVDKDVAVKYMKVNKFEGDLYVSTLRSKGII